MLNNDDITVLELQELPCQPLDYKVFPAKEGEPSFWASKQKPAAKWTKTAGLTSWSDSTDPHKCYVRGGVSLGRNDTSFPGKEPR